MDLHLLSYSPWNWTGHTFEHHRAIGGLYHLARVDAARSYSISAISRLLRPNWYVPPTHRSFKSIIYRFEQGTWCWVTAEWGTQRIVTEYLWFWICAGVSLTVYLIIVVSAYRRSKRNQAQQSEYGRSNGSGNRHETTDGASVEPVSDGQTSRDIGRQEFSAVRSSFMVQWEGAMTPEDSTTSPRQDVQNLPQQRQ